MNNKMQKLNNSLIGQLINEVPSNTSEPDTRDQLLVTIDSHKKTYDHKPSQKILRTYRYFIINTGITLVFDDYLTTLAGDEGVSNLRAEYKIKCLPADVSKLAMAIYNAEDENQILNGVLVQAVSGTGNSTALLENFYAKKGALEKSIINELRQFGLTVLSLKLKLENDEDRLKQQSINISIFKVGLEGGFPKINMGLTAQIGTIAGQESRFLGSGIKEDTVEDEILKIIRTYIGKGISPEELYSDYNSSIKDAVTVKINAYLAGLGRELSDLSFTLHKSGNLSPVILESGNFIDVRVKDSLQSLGLRFSCELVPDKQFKARAFLFPVDNTDVLEKIQDCIKNTISAEIDIEQFSDQLNTTVAEKLAASINSSLRELGREVGFLQLTAKGIPPRDIEIKHEISCFSKDGHEIQVNNILFLQRDYSVNKTLEAARINDFDQWGKNELNRITKNFIINKTYNELLFDFDDRLLRSEMQKEAQKIGYTVNQLIALPQFGTGKPEWFKISYRDTNLNSRIDGIALALSVHVEGRFSNYKKIMKMIVPKESVTESMQKSLDSKIRQFFNSLDPDRFYVRFYHKDEGKGDKKTLEEEIKETVTRHFQEDYEAEIRDVAVNPLNTTLINRFKQLQEGVFECEFQDKTCFFSYVTKISILNVDPERWDVFNSRAYKPRTEDANDSERKDIAAHVRGYIENGLNTELVPLITKGEISSNEDFVREIRRLLDEVTVEVREIFGLAIQIFTPIKVDPEAKLNKKLLQEKNRKTNAELELQETIHIMAIQERRERLESLYKQRKEKEEANYPSNAPDMQRIHDEIEKLEKGITWDSNGPIVLENPFS